MDDLTHVLTAIESAPRWLVLLGGTLLVVLILVILAKLLKFGFQVLAFLVLVAGVGATILLFLE
jgi:hypothetical protein